VRVDEEVRRIDDWHDGRLASDGDVEGAFFEGCDAASLVARTLSEKPQFHSFLLHFSDVFKMLDIRYHRFFIGLLFNG